jgi:hypothetical protein
MKTSNYIKLENILPVIAFALILVLVGSLVYGIISGQVDTSHLS